MMDSTRIYLNAPYKDKALIKKLGANWDEENRGWWVNQNSNLELYKKWLPRMYRPDASPPHITSELVPQSTWYLNLRAWLPKEEWDRVRKDVYKNAGYRCQVCGGKGPEWPVECNEQWQYIPNSSNPKTGVQKLLRLTALCPTCHSIKHAGLSNLRGKLDQTIAQLGFVNGWKKEECLKHLEEARDVADIRNEMTWTFDLSVLKNYGVSKITVDLTQPKELPVIDGITLSYIGFSSVFNRMAGAYMSRDLAKRISKSWPDICWRQLPKSCPAWYAEITDLDGLKIRIISCISEVEIRDNDLDVLREFIQKTTVNRIMVALLAKKDKMESDVAVYEATNAAHPLFLIARFEKDDFTSIACAGEVVTSDVFFECLNGEFQFIGWSDPKTECGLEFIKSKCCMCEKPIYRFTGIVLPNYKVSDWKSNKWQYHKHIALHEASSELLTQIIAAIGEGTVCEGVQTTKIGRQRGGMPIAVCPYCKAEQRLDMILGDYSDGERFSAMAVTDARSGKLVYVPRILGVDYQTMHNVDSSFEGSPFCNNEDAPHWLF